MNIDDLEEAICDVMWKDPSIIANMKNQTDKLCLAALAVDIFVYRYVREPTPAIIRYIYENNPKLLTPSSETEKWAAYVKINPKYLWFAPDSLYVYISAIKMHANALEFIKNHTEDLYKIAVTINPRSITCIENPSQEVIKIALTASYGSAISCLTFSQRTTEWCSYAVSLNPTNLGKVKEDEVYSWQLQELIRTSPQCIEFLDNPSEKLQLIAVRSHPESYKLITEPTEFVTYEAFLKRSSLRLSDAKIQTYDLCAMCLRRDPTDINNVSDDIWDENLTLSIIPLIHFELIPDKFMTEKCAIEYAKIRPYDLINSKYSIHAIKVCPELILKLTDATYDMWFVAVKLQSYLYYAAPNKYRRDEIKLIGNSF
jgi:hypothetical protein